MRNYNLENRSALFLEQSFVKAIFAGGLFWYGYYNYGFCMINLVV